MIAIRSRVAGAGVHDRSHSSSDLGVQVVGDRRRPRLVHRHPPADAVEPPLDPGHVEQLDDRQLRDGAAIGPHLAAPADQVLAAAVGRHRLAAQFGGQRDDRVLGRPDERSAEIDGCARDRRRRRAAADAVAAFENDDVVAEPHQLAGRRQPCEPGTHDDDVGIGWDGHATRLSRREGHDSVVRTDGCDRTRARAARSGRQRGVHLRGAARRVHAADAGRRRSGVWT